MNLIAEIQKYLCKKFGDYIGLKFYNYETGMENFPYAVLQNIKVVEKFIFPSMKFLTANIEIFSDAKSNIECAQKIEDVKNAFHNSQFSTENFRITSTIIKSYSLVKNGEGKWVGEIQLGFSIVKLH